MRLFSRELRKRLLALSMRARGKGANLTNGPHAAGEVGAPRMYQMWTAVQ